jgi:Flp pilus assembly protein TadD
MAKPPSVPKRNDEITQAKGKRPKAAIIPKAAGAGASLAARPRPSRPQPAKYPSAPPRGYGEAKLCKLLASRPDHLGARRNLALLYWQQGRNREAVMQLQAILRAHPHDREAHQTLQMIISQTRGK